MTTRKATVPTFRTSRCSLGALVALLLSASLAATFVAEYWHAPAVSSAAAAALRA